MSFNIGLSGLYAANKQLDVTGNNIANVATNGFKSSRAEFQDVYSASKLGVGSKTVGNGVSLAAISQQFGQGDVNNTGNVLDMAIQGQGFFVLSDNGSLSYTRAGAFQTSKDSYVVTSDGLRLQGYAADENGKILTSSLTDLKIDTLSQPPKATSLVTQGINLNSEATPIPLPTTGPTFVPTDETTYTKKFSTEIYDTQGNKHTLEQYYRKTDQNTWTMYSLIDGRNPQDPTSTSAPTIGSSHSRNDGFSQNTPPPHTSPNSVWPPCLRSASPQEVSASSRGGDFQRIAQPRKAAVTKRVWNSIRTGASSAENTSSISIPSVTRRRPPNWRAPCRQISSTDRIFGRNSSVAVAENSASAFSGCHSGQIGNSWRGCTKYCGTVSSCEASMPVDSARNRNHSGADR